MKKSLLSLAAFAVAALAVGAAHAFGIDAGAVAQTVAQAVFTPEAAAAVPALAGLGTTKYSHEGRVIDWVNGTGGAITSGSVVKMSHVLGVALVDIANGATGSVQVMGVFREIPKVTAAVWAQGEALLWDVSAGKFDDAAAVAASGDVFGSAYAATAGLNGETTALVVFTGQPGVLTA